ncbi:hypothetical protein [Streptomyces sp. NPDC101165]|uniref:hypothetical protein n=1 Tax=Streptomyces sp. NPDC101165 TaxID=3366119 RepID=UPI00380BC19E
MPSEHENATEPLSDAEVTAILGPSVPDSARGGYGDRFEDDAFDYPSPSLSHAWSSDDGVPGPTEATGAESEPGDEEGGSRRSRARDESRWRWTAVRHRSAVTAVAALALLGGFGLALSTVSDTVTSTPHPSGTAQVSAPRSPGSPTLPPDATLPARPPGAGANTAAPPTQTAAVPPVTGDRGDDDHGDDHGEEEQGREDGDHADD